MNQIGISPLLHWCRAYVNEVKCHACVDASAKEMSKRCPNQKGASGLYEHCSLKYCSSQSLLRSDDGSLLTWSSFDKPRDQ
ncbi:hypothetical protein MLD38_015787 [Melastoma candidum]|uniref:Uncharacterized protein n=1 Tax=Melastoma candidum TaxID=119954 RepID=A0ACB9RKY6_9MYRT|nr:hypothetical protein MLD38_015787 [Melastoma candidum]